MKEIGGYFGLEQFSGWEYYEDLYAINLGRTALIYLLENLNCQRLLVPNLLCDSMTNMCTRHHITLTYYNQDKNLMPLLESPLEEGTWLLLVNYYGQLTDEKILLAKERFGHIIVDHTHSFFQRPLPGIPTLYSCRKFFGLPDGAYLSTDLLMPPLPEKDISYGRMGHLLGRYEENASSHYQELHQTASTYYQESPKAMSKLTHNLLRAIDYDSVKKQRNENYQTLEAHLGSQNAISQQYHGKAGALIPAPFQTPDGPLAYPFYFPKGVALRKALAAEKIYVPTYWSNVMEACSEDSIEYQCAANILALPCDHRYRTADMERVVLTIETTIPLLQQQVLRKGEICIVC